MRQSLAAAAHENDNERGMIKDGVYFTLSEARMGSAGFIYKTTLMRASDEPVAIVSA
jgi:hypothetical protein